MKKQEPEIIRGSGHGDWDFNLPNADVRQLKAILAAAIIKALDRKGLSVRIAQRLTGIDAGDFSRVRNADFRRISVERLVTMINRLGSRVDVKVKVRRTETTAKGVARRAGQGPRLFPSSRAGFKSGWRRDDEPSRVQALAISRI